MIHISDTNLNEVISSNKSLMIDFWATWCGPCRMLAPTIDAVAEKYEGKVAVAKCDVDDASGAAMAFGIRTIPTLVFIQDGKVVDKLVGYVPQEEVEAKLAKII